MHDMMGGDVGVLVFLIFVVLLIVALMRLGLFR
jgi:hypothetical protein